MCRRMRTLIGRIATVEAAQGRATVILFHWIYTDIRKVRYRPTCSQSQIHTGKLSSSVQLSWTVFRCVLGWTDVDICDASSVWTGFRRQYTEWGKIKYPNTKIAISQKRLNIFAPNFAHLFVRILCTNVLLCAVFTWHYRTSNWRKRKLQERISQLNKKLILLLK